MEENKVRVAWWKKTMQKVAGWLGPRLDKYRVTEEEEVPELYLPETTEDFIWLVRKLPQTVLSAEQRVRLSGVMSFETRRVSDLMLPRNEVTFVFENDFLGPLMLDKLYHSGFSHFPVIGSGGEIVGILHTSALNKLEAKETDRAAHYLDSKIHYLEADGTLRDALLAVGKEGATFFLVRDRVGKVVGLLTYTMMMAALLGEEAVCENDG